MVLGSIKKLAKEGRNLTQFTLMKVFGQVIFLGIPLVLAKFVSPEQFGSYSLSMMLVYLLTTLFIHSAQTPCLKYANEDLKKTGKINKVFSVVTLFWLVAVAGFVILFLLFRRPVESFAAIDNQEFLLLLLALFGISVRIFYDSLFLALNRRLENAKYWLLMGLLALAYVLVAYYTFGITISSVFVMFFVIPPIAFVCIFKKEDYEKLRPWSIDKNYIKKIWKFAAWVAIGGAAVYLLNWGDNLVLRLTLSMDDIGVYNLAYQIFKGAIVLTGFLNGYFLPFLSQNLQNKLKLREYVYKKRPILMVVGTAMIVILGLLIPHLIQLIYGDAYALAGTALYYLFVGLIFALYQQLYMPLFNALERYKFVQITNIVLVIFNLGMDYFLVLRWHNIVAAAVATMLTYIIMAIVYEIYYLIKLKLFIIMPPKDYQ